MDRIRRSLRESFRRKKRNNHENQPECCKPHQWQSDEDAVRSGECSFPVKYLGCREVKDSRGMQICEDALRDLRVCIVWSDITCVWLIRLFIAWCRPRDAEVSKGSFMFREMDCELWIEKRRFVYILDVGVVTHHVLRSINTGSDCGSNDRKSVLLCPGQESWERIFLHL